MLSYRSQPNNLLHNDKSRFVMIVINATALTNICNKIILIQTFRNIIAHQGRCSLNHKVVKTNLAKDSFDTLYKWWWWVWTTTLVDKSSFMKCFVCVVIIYYWWVSKSTLVASFCDEFLEIALEIRNLLQNCVSNFIFIWWCR